MMAQKVAGRRKEPPLYRTLKWLQEFYYTLQDENLHGIYFCRLGQNGQIHGTKYYFTFQFQL